MVTRTGGRRGGFSLVEMIIALSITATLMTAALSALDASFKSYKATTDAVSTHVVTRVVINRITSMVRNGDEFGPFPLDPLDKTQNPLKSTFMEFVGSRSEDGTSKTVVRLERRDAAEGSAAPYELWYVAKTFVNSTLTESESRVLLNNVQQASFTLYYDMVPQLQRATVDLIVKPDDLGATGPHSDMGAPPIRMVTSVSPRRLE